MAGQQEKFSRFFLVFLSSCVFLTFCASCQQKDDCDCLCEGGDFDEETGDPNDLENEDSISEDLYEEEFQEWQPGWFVFTEIMYDPAAIKDGDGEWVEVLNASQQTLSLIGCSFSDGNESHATPIAYSEMIEPGERLIFGIDRKTTYIQDVAPDWQWGDFNLGNEEDGVRLECDGTLIDEVYYSLDGFPFTLPEGSSFSLCAEHENSEDNDNLRYWYASETRMGNLDYGSPRTAGRSCGVITDGDTEHEEE